MRPFRSREFVAIAKAKFSRSAPPRSYFSFIERIEGVRSYRPHARSRYSKERYHETTNSSSDDGLAGIELARKRSRGARRRRRLWRACGRFWRRRPYGRRWSHRRLWRGSHWRPGRGPLWGIAALSELADIFVLFHLVSCVTLLTTCRYSLGASTVWFVPFVPGMFA